MNWASDEDEHLEIPEKKLAKRQDKRGIKTSYWTPSVHNASFALPAYAERVVEKAIAAGRNEIKAVGGKNKGDK